MSLRLSPQGLLLLLFLPNGFPSQASSDGRNSWLGNGCPPHATGQFPYEGDCKRFYNCYKGRGQLSICAPGTLFNPQTLECDFPSKVNCLQGASQGAETKGHYIYAAKQVNDQLPKNYHGGVQPPGDYHGGVQPPSEISRFYSESSGSQTYGARAGSTNGQVAVDLEPGFELGSSHGAPVASGHLLPPEPQPPSRKSTQSQPLDSGYSVPVLVYSSQPKYQSKGSAHQSTVHSSNIHQSYGSSGNTGFKPNAPPAAGSLYQSKSSQTGSSSFLTSGSSYQSEAGRGPLPGSYSSRGVPSTYQTVPASPAYYQGASSYHYQSGASYHPTPYSPNYSPVSPSQTFYSSPPSSYQPSSPSLYPNRSPSYPQQGSESNFYNPSHSNSRSSSSFNSQQSLYTSQNKDFDKKFEEVVPRPSVTYAFIPPPTITQGNQNVRFPDARPPIQSPAVRYPVSETSGYLNPYEPRETVDASLNPYWNSGGVRETDQITSQTSDSPTPGKSNSRGSSGDNYCPKDFSGLLPHPDCTKFLSCANGRTFVMDCGPGTRFNKDLLICDHAYKIQCQSGDHSLDDTDVLITEESQDRPGIYSRGGFNTDEPSQITPTTTSSSPLDVERNDDIGHDLPSQDYETFQKPLIIVNEEKTTEAQPKNDHIFRPANITLAKSKFVVKRNSTYDRQLLRLRGSSSQFEGFVEMQLSPGSWGIMCDKKNSWKSEEAHVICRTLGFPRGAELTWQGIPPEVTNLTSNLLAADEVICTGDEESALECSFNVGSGCEPGENGVWVRCYGQGQSSCESGELALDGQCYFLVVPDEDTPTEDLVGFTQGEALKYCQTKGGRLLDISSQLENDFISEWLIRQNVDGNIMTSGVGTLLMGVPVWIWEGGQDAFRYHNWWPGWRGVNSVPPKLSSGQAHCIVLKRFFPCSGSNKTEEKMCDAQYYFWDIEDCTSMSTSQPYVCKRPANNIGCVSGTGASYKGAANVTISGRHCLNWDTKELKSELKYKVSESDRMMSLSGHNYCRNIAGKENHPWCFIRDKGGNVKKELCDIPLCSEEGQVKVMEKSARQFLCPKDHFSCGVNGECVPSKKVCDGRYDCTNGYDESNCRTEKLQVAEREILLNFTVQVNVKLTVMELEVFVELPVAKCAEKCMERVNCRSFSYYSQEKQCLLSEGNVGLSGALIQAEGWYYYELESKSINCQLSHTCKNGKCIANETVCNGRNDCGDNSDESNCSWLKQKIQIRLTGGKSKNEGAIEVKASDRWGLVCDDEFDMKDANVICRHLGFPYGALEIKKHSYFKLNHTSSFLIDNLNCTGNESSLADCHHNGWGIHDCKDEEYMNSIDYVKCSNKAAGVVCKVGKSECSFNYWQCEKSNECIPLGFLCDNVKDCADNSDEDPTKCEAPVEVRLIGIAKSSNVTEGRVEVRRFGVWGTVCDDDFGPREAEVICNSLGYEGPAQAYKEAAYGAGDGIIWLDQVHCLGNETDISQCMSDPWGQTNCRHNEDVAVACSLQRFKKPTKELKKPIENENEDSQDIDVVLDDIFLANCGKPDDDLNLISTDFTPRVVSGFETQKGAYPWQASIRVKSVSGQSNHWCGAVIISRFHVISAGHCLRDYIKAAYFVRAGDYDNQVAEGTEQDYEIDEIWIHPDFDKEVRLNNDIAVVKIKNPGFDFNTWVLPACLPTNDNVKMPTNCTISGWGSSSSPGMGFARTLHATWLNTLGIEECRSLSIYGDALSDGMFCAGSLKGGPDSCQGDSGGPLVCPLRDQQTLFGITSWGHGCGRSNSPGVYTKVPQYLNWIMEKVKFSMRNYQRAENRKMLYDR